MYIYIYIHNILYIYIDTSEITVCQQFLDHWLLRGAWFVLPAGSCSRGEDVDRGWFGEFKAISTTNTHKSTGWGPIAS